MKKSRFLISTLAAAGFGTTHPLQAAITTATGARGGSGDDPNSTKLFQLFKQDHLYTLAGHASHSSHSSHASHASHQSGSGGGSYPVYTPAPAYTPQPLYTAPSYIPTPKPAPAPADSDTLRATPPSADGPKPLSGRSELFNSIVKRVQLGLLAYGYYDGPINGVVGAQTRTALKQFQAAFHMPQTGTITPEVLDALKISAQ
jgi:His-Xaa-Ser repeat protein HxsA